MRSISCGEVPAQCVSKRHAGQNDSDNPCRQKHEHAHQRRENSKCRPFECARYKTAGEDNQQRLPGPDLRDNVEDEEFFTLCSSQCFRLLAACLRADVTGPSGQLCTKELEPEPFSACWISESHKLRDRPQSLVSTRKTHCSGYKS